jgi:hypothetical protein
MNESQKLSQAIERLKKEVAEYKKFVAASSATRNSIAGLKEYGPQTMVAAAASALRKL